MGREVDPRLLKLDNKYKGRRGFVIGGGPSIGDYSKSTIKKLSKEKTVGSNQAYLLFTPSFLVFTDRGYFREFHKNLVELKCPILCPDRLQKVEGRRYWKFLCGSYKESGLAPKSFKEEIPIWTNTGVTALRIAYILGMDPIYLVGVDLNKEDKAKGITHFHNTYDAKRKNATRVERYDIFVKSFRKTIEAMSDRRIRSCSPRCNALNGEVIPFVPLEKVLSHAWDGKENLA